MGIRTRSGMIRWGKWAALLGVPLIILVAGYTYVARLRSRTTIDSSVIQTMRDADSIIIKDDQGGMSQREKHYTLTRDGDQFIGEAAFTLRLSNGDQHATTAQLAIPREVIQRFLETLVQEPFEEGDYPPAPTPNDYYLDRSIELSTRGKTFRFFTTSLEGGDWILTFDGNRFKTSTPHTGLNILAAHLRPEVYLQLEHASDRGLSNPTPTTTGMRTPLTPTATAKGR